MVNTWEWKKKGKSPKLPSVATYSEIAQTTRCKERKLEVISKSQRKLKQNKLCCNIVKPTVVFKNKKLRKQWCSCADMKHLPCTTEKKSFYVKIHLGIMKEKKKTIKRFKKKKKRGKLRRKWSTKDQTEKGKGKKKATLNNTLTSVHLFYCTVYASTRSILSFKRLLGYANMYTCLCESCTWCLCVDHTLVMVRHLFLLLTNCMFLPSRHSVVSIW